MESFERMGNWWLPEEPETKIPGKLSFDDRRSANSIEGDFILNSMKVCIQASGDLVL